MTRSAAMNSGSSFRAGNTRLRALVEKFRSRILVLGLAYKKNVDDVRETPAAEIMELLIERGARVEYSDFYVPRFPRMRAHYLDLESVPLEAKALEGYDCVVLVTDHDAFDYDLVLRHARLVVDTRGRHAAGTPKVVED